MSKSVVPILFVVLTACSTSSRNSASSGLAGVWVMSLDGRPFMVLTLEQDGDAFSGTLARPRTMTTDGLTFSQVGGGTLAERVSGTTLGETSLTLVAQHPTDPSDTTEFEFRQTTADTAGVKPVGAPFDAWLFKRHAGTETPRVATDWNAARSYALVGPDEAPNAEMAEIYKADQTARQSVDAFEAQADRIAVEDAARRDRVRVLIDSGALRAAEDFRLAAVVFQHGREPREYLLAHTLALVALARGDRRAAWIAAASFDRYLHAIGQPQIFGSQFPGGALSQEPYDRTLVSDALRRELGVPAMQEQQKQMEALLGKRGRVATTPDRIP